MTWLLVILLFKVILQVAKFRVVDVRLHFVGDMTARYRMDCFLTHTTLSVKYQYINLLFLD
jgi:hypothetical protein